jgi:HTH-type transcriptional regulator, competence development regulator
MNAKRLGEELRRLRKAKNGGEGVSLRDVEKETKISNAYLSLIENGDIESPSPRRLHKLADYYGVPYEALMFLAGYMKEPAQKKASRAVRMPVHAEHYFRQANLTDEEWDKLVTFASSYVKPHKS